jgi:DNA polymerase (family 10)
MHRLDAPEVTKLLHELGQRTLLRGGNPYRARAYTRAAENLLASPEPLGDLIASNRLRDIPGVGDTIANIVTKLHRHGAHPMLDELRKEVPHGVLEMLSIPGRPRETSAPYLRLGPLA